MLPKTRLLFLIRFPLQRTIVKPACPEEWVVIPPDEQNTIDFNVCKGNNTELSLYVLCLDTAHRKTMPRFVKSAGKNVKQEVAGEGLVPDGGVLSRHTVLGAPPGTGQMPSHGTWAFGMECQVWEGLGTGPPFPVGIWKGRDTIPSPGSRRQLQPGDLQWPVQARGLVINASLSRYCPRESP